MYYMLKGQLLPSSHFISIALFHSHFHFPSIVLHIQTEAYRKTTDLTLDIQLKDKEQGTRQTSETPYNHNIFNLSHLLQLTV